MRMSILQMIYVAVGVVLMTILVTAIVAIVLFVMSAFSPTLAHADTFRPSRVRMLTHSTQQFNDELSASWHFIPAPNLLDEVAPVTYGCLDWTPTPTLTISPTIGWSFKSDEPIVSLRLTHKIGKFWGWIDLEEKPRSQTFYFFAQGEYKLTDFLHIGAEEESWGDIRHLGVASHGAGPNLLLRFGKSVGADTAIHFRSVGGGATKPEFFFRYHLFF
ncbi:MAG: hypothetical protein UX10_C0035G0005 [Candidatus Magasanikbacteria bacterium GW2011_GWA2_45_39]|uniref:Uncharacterized protein n=1 Tax=Candidatus Magasanikbacteria bacterium GW2011_GWA2_45_39 TaxID=1619041 RepID=A0A0G1MDL1_9BACT|nr:MAG: hypothetical protein UX10_C0035G0005 [Candidatus Magasanikbacteria bacterium GW2011_GWA2_45_39]HBW73794.1 hypothetical protein [Candidatus Magasanikbacteria bacterium]